MDLVIEKMLMESKSLAKKHPKRAYQLAKDAYKQAQEQSMKEEEAYARYHMAYACRVMSTYSEGLTHALTSLNMFETMNHAMGIIQASNIVGIIYFYYGDLTRSLSYFMKVIDGLKKKSNIVLEVSVTNNIGEVYREDGQLEEAVVWFTKAKTMTVQNQMDNEWATVATNLGEIYHLQGKETDAFQEFEQAYRKSIAADNILLQGEIATKLGRSYCLRGEYEKARQFFKKGKFCFSQIENKYYLVELLQNMAEMEELIGGNPIALLQEALGICQYLNLDKKMGHLYQELSSYYEKHYNYERALEYYKLFYRKDKEIAASHLSNRMEILAVELERNKDKDEIQRISSISTALQKDVEQAKDEVSRLKAHNRQLKKENILDEMTRTFNRRGIYSKYESLRKAYPDYKMGLLMIDVDHFKRYNDAWGHIQGDICLSRIAQVMKTCHPIHGFVGRFGGEEFIICFPIIGATDIKEIAETIRHSVEELHIPSFPDSKEYVTVSIGGREITHNAHSIIEHIESVDRQLYRAKNAGRNRICIEGV